MAYQRIWALPLAGGLLLGVGTSDHAADSASGAPERLAAEALAGPVSAVVERVVDGDTVDVRARIWLGQSLTVRVRIDGVDAPETRSDCADERRLAIDARDFLTRRLLNREITLLRVVYDKFGGRVRAEISDTDGNIGQALLAAGLARPYRGERREPWCAAG
jgi:endonuclease YncB( thermonuclease family)